MTHGVNVPKAPPESVAHAIFDGVEKGEEDIFPDPCQSPPLMAGVNASDFIRTDIRTTSGVPSRRSALTLPKFL
jgi:hypothetical protein